MDKSEIEQLIINEIPYLKRRKCTPRVMEFVDSLLDELIEMKAYTVDE